MHRTKYFLWSFILGFIALTLPVQARESGFQPLLVDVIATPGSERFVTAEDGSLQGFSYEGNSIPGFPVRQENAVFISSPLAADVNGDGVLDIVVLSRNVAGQFAVNAYQGSGALLGSSPMQNGEVYYDPALLAAGNGVDDIVVATSAGNVLKFHFANQAFTSSALFNLNVPAAVSTRVNGSEIFVAFPGRNAVDVYRLSNNVWARNRSLAVPTAWLFAPTFDENNTLYGVNRNNELMAINATTGAAVAGFPVALTRQGSASPVLGEINEANPNGEILVSLNNGSTVVVNKQGQILDQKKNDAVASPSTATVDGPKNGFFKSVKNSGTALYVGTRTTLFSFWTRIKPSIVQSTGDINVKINGQSVASAGIVDLGVVQFNTPRDITLALENTGSGSLILPNNPVTVSGTDSALFQITQAPALQVASNRSTSVRLRFQSATKGQKTAMLQIQSNDPDESPYTLVLQINSVNNLVRDGDMEALNVLDWRNWGTPELKEKSTTYAVSPTQSMHIVMSTHSGMQQLNIPVLANHRYRYSFRYRIISGRVETNLGIRDSNGDFENKAASLSLMGGWQVYTREFTVPATFVSDFRAAIRIKYGEAYIDDVVVEEVVPNASLVVDGNMEANGLGVWQTYGHPTLLEKSASTTHSGLQSLRIKVGPNTGAQELNIALRAGTQYRFKFWYRLYGTMIPRLSTTDSNQDFEFPVADPREPYLMTTNGEWREYTRVFTVPANNVSTFRVVFQLSSSEFIPNQLYRLIPFGEAYIDDVVIEPVQ